MSFQRQTVFISFPNNAFFIPCSALQVVYSTIMELLSTDVTKASDSNGNGSGSGVIDLSAEGGDSKPPGASPANGDGGNKAGATDEEDEEEDAVSPFASLTAAMKNRFVRDSEE